MGKKESSTKAPGFAIVGGGVWAKHHMNAVRNLEEQGQARLVAVCARTQETVDRVSSEWGIEGIRNFNELIAREDIDAVAICTPDHLHREMTVEALKAGKHVLCEKPMDLSIEGCEEMIAASNEADRLLFLDFHKRFDPVQQRARDLIQTGTLGDIQYGYCWMEDKIIVPRDWFAKWAENTTIFWFIGVHQVDMLRWTLGREVSKVRARGWRGKLSSLGIDTYDSIHAELEFEGGSVFSVDVNWITPENFAAIVNQGSRFIGTEGFLEIDAQDRGFGGSWGGSPWQTINVGSAHSFTDCCGQAVHQGYFVDPTKQFMGMVDFLKKGGELRTLEGMYPSGRDGRQATAVALAVHKSLSQSGKTVAL